MLVYIKVSQEGFPETETEYTALQGFRDLGCEIRFFYSEDELEDWRPDRIIVGGKTIIRKKMAEYDIHPKDYDYPDELRTFLGRTIWEDSLDHVLSQKDKWPVFVKPIRNKAFVGFVLNNTDSIPRLRDAQPKEPVICSEVVEFLSEYRAFVRYGNIWDVRPYKGDWHIQYDVSTIEKIVNAYKEIPAGCAIDFGVTRDGRTLLVEVNDGYAVGCYGADPTEYAKTLSARWCELVGIHDECDTYHEGTDWKKERGL